MSALKLTDEVHKGPQKWLSDVQSPSSMSFNDANAFSFDKLTDPEVPELLNGGTIWVASLDDHEFLGDVSYLFS